ncbi:MAG: class I tRNA ligase family protein, partial [Pseudomonadota bacterium]
VDAINLIPDDIRGLDRFEARKVVVDQITAEGLAVMTTVTKEVDGEQVSETIPMVENKPIMQPFGDRSKVVIEPMLTDQWFVDTDKIVGPALDAVNNGHIKLLPEREKKVWDHWLENIEPWCISRQLWWGHQIPVWYGPGIKNLVKQADGSMDCEWDFQNPKSVCAPDEETAVRLMYAEYPFSLHIIEVVGSASEAEQCTTSYSSDPAREDDICIYRDPDVLDTWFSSGLWPIGTLGWPDWDEDTSKYFPTNDLITGTDILFFWVARMVMMQMAVLDDKPVDQKIPFSTVYLHGLVRDAKGKKMSKSTGNVVDPLDIVDEYGADALRFSSAAMAAMGGVLKLDMQRIAGYRNFGTKLWNACRFAEMNDVFENRGTETPQPTKAVNQWIMSETAAVRDVVQDALNAYRFNDAALSLYAFVWGKVCDWYIELSKPLLQGDDAAAKAETQETLAWVLDQ